MNKVKVKTKNNMARGKGKGKGVDIAVCEDNSLLQKITCHMGSHSVTCHPAAVTFPPTFTPAKAES